MTILCHFKCTLGQTLMFLISSFFFATTATTALATENQVQDNAARDLTVNTLFISDDSRNVSGVADYFIEPDDLALAGIETAINDVNRTGKFLGYQFVKPVAKTISSNEITMNRDELNTVDLIITDLSADSFNGLLGLLQPQQKTPIVFNVGNQLDDLRTRYCSAPVFHSVPSHAMRADAMAQWMVSKRLKEILLIHGDNPLDTAFADSLQASAKRYKLSIEEVKKWSFDFDLRRSAAEEIPQFTNIGRSYDAVWVADALNLFGFGIPYNTHRQVPVLGDAGLRPLAWHGAHERWGARQLQGRFKQQHGREMRSQDFSAYLAVVSVATALQTSGLSFENMASRLLAEEFNLAAYKGRKLSFRNHSKQLRMPLALVAGKAIVSHAPLPGFLHQSNEMDTLGFLSPNLCDN